MCVCDRALITRLSGLDSQQAGMKANLPAHSNTSVVSQKIPFLYRSHAKWTFILRATQTTKPIGFPIFAMVVEIK